jgi:tight adherence protein B
MLLFLVLLALSFVVFWYIFRPTKAETAVRHHLEEIQDSVAEETGVTILKEEGYGNNPDLARVIRQIPGAHATLELIQQSGQKWTVGQVMGSTFGAAILVAWITSWFIPSILLSLLTALAAGSIPYIALVIVREQRFRNCDKLLPEAIELMSRGLRAGHSLNAVLEMVANEIGDPISTEFKRMHEEHALGLPLREATLNLVTRLPRDDVRFLATAILLQKETGANLAQILDKTAAVARERARLRGQLRIYTAQGRITGWILCLMPFGIFALLGSLNWNFEKLLFTERLGVILVYAGLALMLAGILWIRRIIDVKV